MDAADYDLLLDIVEYARRIDLQTEGLSQEQFARDVDVEDATAYRLIAIAEACRQLSDEVKGRHPQLPWRELRGLRNVIAHEYAQRESAIIWDTVRVALPQLVAACNEELRRLNRGKR